MVLVAYGSLQVLPGLIGPLSNLHSVSDWWSQVHQQTAPAEVTFLVFTSLFSLLSISLSMIASTARFEQYANPFAEIGMDALLMVCWFGGFIALPVFLKQRVCFGTVCKVAYASVFFSAMEWVLFAATMSWAVVCLVRGRRKTPETPEKDIEGDAELVAVFVNGKQ
jgi:Membrane-associating domain